MGRKIEVTEALCLVRKVFCGELLRAQMPDLHRQAQVYIGVAIMLAHPNDYFENPANYYIGKGGTTGLCYGPALCALLQTGIINYHHPRFTTESSFISASRNVGLHYSLQRKPPSVTLDPPDELVALVRELGLTPAIAAFHDQAMHQAWADAEQAQKILLENTADYAVAQLMSAYEVAVLAMVVEKLQDKLRRS